MRAAFAGRPATHRGGTSLAFRLPTATKSRGIRLYRLPELTEATWHFDNAGFIAGTVVGFANDDDQAYALTAQNEFTVLDLAIGRVRAVDTGIVMAALGPTGIPLAVRRDRSVETIVNRAVVPWGAKLPSLPTHLWGGTGGQVIAVMQTDSGRQLVLLTQGQAPVTQRLSEGPVAASLWGDIVAVAADTGVVLYEPSKEHPPTFVRLRTHPRAIAVSPSGNTVYAVAEQRDLLVIDRFQTRLLQRIKLPAEGGALRADPMGRLLLVKPASGDSIWIVDPARGELIAAVPGEWSDDLPAVAPDGTVLLRRGADVVALAPVTLEVLGRTIGGAKDRWLLAEWDARRPALQAARDTAAPVTTGTEELFVQVSSSSNATLATDLARSLQSAGLKASVLPPSESDSSYKVVLGPYPTRAAADAIGRKLGRPYWIFARDSLRTP